MTDGLAAGREVILYNGRGVASSSGKSCTRIEHMADDAAAVICALGLRQVDVLGFSLSGYQAQDLTRRHPDLVRKLMLLGTGPRGGNSDSDPGVLERAPRPVPTVDDLTSPPAQNDVPAPVISSALTFASPLHMRITSRSAGVSWSDSAFRACGRFQVAMATRSRTHAQQVVGAGVDVKVSGGVHEGIPARSDSARRLAR